MRVSIIQPNYIPWRGYFDFFKQSDVFVFYNDVMYTKNDWRNRNTIKTPDGLQWLTIPVNDNKRVSKGLLINGATTLGSDWKERHLSSLELNYKNAPFIGEVLDIMEEGFMGDSYDLSEICISITQKILDYLGINCKTVRSSEIGYSNLSKTDRVVQICKELKATEYLSGDAAKDYMEMEKFGEIRVLWHRYKEKVYPQLWGDFISKVSIVDLLANCGTKAYDII